MPAVLKRDPAARLLVVGSGPYEAELRELARRLDVADAVSFVVVPTDDPAAMAGLLAEVSIVVLMSEFETHPLVALEAAAARRRLLVADRAGLGELAAAGHARGIDLDASAEELAAAIFDEMDRPAPARAPDLTSWDECTGALIDLYASVA
jgi:glycosyltransferase involved in cell wall biosynthesis